MKKTNRKNTELIEKLSLFECLNIENGYDILYFS